ncbi:hypothetical protein BKA70DRAFT_1286390 [Coprinopsis sp. MPI-PUGE-AT-0042]|nr:hypothetical protein BKA70DRAFT_1286390 [Coprinopsis sp. MPI-PUGE-AT-0042]
MARKNRRGKRHPKPSADPPVKSVGLFVTTDLELAIESCRKEVELIAKTCRSKNKKFRDREFDLQYDGFLCLNGYKLGECAIAKREVQRVTEIFDEPRFFPRGGAIMSNSIAQGSLGDCYFLSALAVVSSIPGLIEKICVARDQAVGVYGFIFYSDHGWKSVVVDDMLFTGASKFEELDTASKALYHHNKDRYNAVARKGGYTLLFAKPGAEGEMWVPLIEKAYAKHYGNFSHIVGGYTPEAVEDLTGGVSTTFIAKDILDVDQFWTEELVNVNKDRLFGCSFNSLNGNDEQVDPDVEGLFGGHAYSILRAVECKGKRFLVVRNPWGKGEWTGRWSDGSKEWTQEWVTILPQLEHSFGNDGQFVMEYSDFLQAFEEIERTFIFDDTWIAGSCWMKAPLGQQVQAFGYGTLSFDVNIPEKSNAIIALSRLNNRFFDSIKKDVDISLEFAVVRRGEREPFATASEWRPFCSRSVTLEIDLEPGAYHIFVRFERETGNTGFDYDGLNLSSRVKARVVSNRVQSQSAMESWRSNLQKAFIPKSLKTVIAERIDQDAAAEAKKKADEEARIAKEKEQKKKQEEDVKQAKEEQPKEEKLKEAEGDKTKDLNGDATAGEKGGDEEETKVEGETKVGEEKEKDEGDDDSDDDSSDDEDDEENMAWNDMLEDPGHDIFVRLRVYTQTKEPATIVGRLN